MATSLSSRDATGLVRGWLVMARIPFLSVGVMPFILGSYLAWRVSGTLHVPVLVVSVTAVVLIMLATYASGEYYDLEGDRLSARMERNRFTGGSQAVAQGTVPPFHALAAACLYAAAAAVLGLVLRFYYHTGPWTIPLGVIGLFCGLFYSTRPIRIVKRGMGEIVIGLCYGWLPVAVSFYLQTSRFDLLAHWMSIPIALTIINVILINEFPDFPADRATGKKTLAVRIGKERASRLYAAVQVSAVLVFPTATLAGAPKLIWAFFPLIALCGLHPALGMARGDYRDRHKLERMCAATIVTNLMIPIAYIAGLALGE